MSNTAPTRRCLSCDLDISHRDPQALYCDSTCQQRVKNARRMQRRRDAGDLCVEPECSNARRFADGLCKSHGNRKREQSLGLTWRDRSGDRERIRQKDRMKTRRRRARTRDPQAEDIYIDVVGERDGWRCGICRRAIDKAKAYPHPRSPSLDHIEPISRGGAHTYANVRIAHLKCNVDRSNVFDHEQLALFG